MSNQFVVLLVEDSPADIRLTREALAGGHLLHELRVLPDGAQALAFLRREAPFVDAPRPDMVLLDLNLPGRSGLEVLAEIKADPGLARIPVIILSGSDAQMDISMAYDSFANGYITKPVDLDQFIQVVRSIEGFWLEIVKLPR